MHCPKSTLSLVALLVAASACANQAAEDSATTRSALSAGDASDGAAAAPALLPVQSVADAASDPWVDASVLSPAGTNSPSPVPVLAPALLAQLRGDASTPYPRPLSDAGPSTEPVPLCEVGAAAPYCDGSEHLVACPFARTPVGTCRAAHGSSRSRIFYCCK